MCVDFTNLNMTFPKDSYPLPSIDNLIEKSSRSELLSFMDAYSCYNQIKMKKEDEEKIAFIADLRTFYFQVMPFSLKNASVTFQRLMNKVFEKQIEKNVEVYVDDILVQSR